MAIEINCKKLSMWNAVEQQVTTQNTKATRANATKATEDNLGL